jgi:3-oxoacyl-[acyl-carrier protein] reductase
MDLQLQGRNAVVLGGSRGIGRAIALGLAAEGANLALCARSEPALLRAAGDARALGVTCFARPCDLADAQDLAGFLDAAHEALGSVDILVHNASALALGADLGAFEASLRVDVLGAARACDKVIPWMAQAGGGSILLVSSIAGLEASPGTDIGYATAKGALITYAKKLSVVHGPQRIRVNAIAPGSIEFPGGLWDRVRQDDPAAYDNVRGRIPWGRMGTAGEVADLAVFLCSPRSLWVTGACVPVDGGQHKGVR